jgi:predicted DNA-binding antitoxin AbrB/MazE fold protein
MVQQLEAVFEQGVLRPLEPLSLTENQHVLVTISDIKVAEKTSAQVDETSARVVEREWLSIHRGEYRGQWVALQGSVLLSHGPRAQAVLDEARRKGVLRPLLVSIPEDFDLPSAGWL